MDTQCNQESFPFHPLRNRDVIARFDGGTITSDGGALLLREVEQRTGIIRQFARCFTDHRSPLLIEHTVEELVGQRIYGLALGYEDLNDHDELRRDPLLAVVVGKADPTGQNRRTAEDKGKALAGKSTLNRLELTLPEASGATRYKKIVVNSDSVEELFPELYIQAHGKAPDRIVLDVDATDALIHGMQEGRFFHGYYRNYCYLPLYIFCGEFLLCAKLRRSNIDAAEGTVEEVERIVRRIRQTWADVPIVVRGDSGFARDKIMRWCEVNGVEFVLGLAKNKRLIKAIAGELRDAEAKYEETGESVRVYKELVYRTRKSWSRSRRVVAKAEHLAKGSNPRFVVTSLSKEEFEACVLYEQEYCGRGDMENRIKEQQLYLFADRTSAATMRANQLRLWLSSIAYWLMQSLRRLALDDTEMARSQCRTIRLKILKLGASVRITVRKIWLSLPSSYPYKALFQQIYEKLREPSLPGRTEVSM